MHNAISPSRVVGGEQGGFVRFVCVYVCMYVCVWMGVCGCKLLMNVVSAHAFLCTFFVANSSYYNWIDGSCFHRRQT